MVPWTELLDDGGYRCHGCPVPGWCMDEGKCARAGSVLRHRPPLSAWLTGTPSTTFPTPPESLP